MACMNDDLCGVMDDEACECDPPCEDCGCVVCLCGPWACGGGEGREPRCDDD